MENTGHVQRGQADVGEHQEGPDGVEEHKVDAVGRVGAIIVAVARPVVVVAVVYAVVDADDVGDEAEFDEGEEGGDEVRDGDESECHFVVIDLFAVRKAVYLGF